MLRSLSEDDIESLRKWRNDKKNTRHLSNIPHITKEMQKEWFHNYLNNSDEMTFAIVEIASLSQLVGSLTLYDFDEDNCMFGKLLVGEDKAHGMRVGVNSTIAAVKIAFEQLGMERINLVVYEDNKIAIKVYKEAGFRIDELHRTAEGRNEYTMILTREEFLHEYH